MAIELRVLTEHEARPSAVFYIGEGITEISAGKHFKIETSPQGEDLLNAVVPDGKLWTVSIRISVKEIDA